METISERYAYRTQAPRTIGDRILERMEYLGIESMRAFELETDIPHGVITRLLSGERKWPSVQHAMNLARGLGVTVDWLVGMYEMPAGGVKRPAGVGGSRKGRESQGLGYHGDTIGERISERMALLGIDSLRQLEIMTGISHGVLSRLVRGQRQWPSVPHVKSLARALGVTVDWLVGM